MERHRISFILEWVWSDYVLLNWCL